MVRNAEDKLDLTKVSPSFIPSLRCNEECTFCMYKAGPKNNIQLDFNLAKYFVKTVDWEKICGWGFYGGEPFIEMDLYQQFYKLIPENIPKFIITNGLWSKSKNDTDKFLYWCANNKFRVVISSCTKEHRNHQDLKIIKKLSHLEGIHVKFKEEELHPMGRNFYGTVCCTEKCIWHKQPIRIGLFPTGHVLLQNCNGVYPIISHIKEGFITAFNNAVRVRQNGISECAKLESINDILSKMK